MSDKPLEEQEKNQALFLHLVMMLSASAMQQMGKTVNPATGKTEINLDGAAFAIDMLTMLDARTTGNLTKDESQLLQSQLSSLRLNFFETSEQQKRDKPEPPTTKPADGSATDSADTAAPPPAPATPQSGESSDSSPSSGPEPSASTGGDESSPRYHKSYG